MSSCENDMSTEFENIYVVWRNTTYLFTVRSDERHVVCNISFSWDPINDIEFLFRRQFWCRLIENDMAFLLRNFVLFLFFFFVFSNGLENDWCLLHTKWRYGSFSGIFPRPFWKWDVIFQSWYRTWVWNVVCSWIAVGEWRVKWSRFNSSWWFECFVQF